MGAVFFGAINGSAEPCTEESARETLKADRAAPEPCDATSAGNRLSGAIRQLLLVGP